MFTLILTLLVGSVSAPGSRQEPQNIVYAKDKANESFGLGASLHLSVDYRIGRTPSDNVAHEFWLCLHWDFASFHRTVESLSIRNTHLDMI